MPALITPQKLRRAIDASNKMLEPHRELRQQNFCEFWGRFYPTGTPNEVRRHLNLVHRAASTLISHIAGRNPVHEIDTDDPTLEGEALRVSMILDRLSETLRRKHISRLCLLDAMLGPMGIVRTGLKAAEEMIKVNGRSYNPGAPYIRRVSFDDYICDPSARSDEELLWEGEYLVIRKADALEMGIYDPAVIERLPTTMEQAGRSGDRLADSAAGSVSREERNQLVECIEVIDVAVYDDMGCQMITMPAAEGFDEDFLRVVDFDGLNRGPFRKLVFQPLPDQVVGLPPAALWREQAEAFYDIVNKMVDQAKRSKNIVVGDRDTSEDDLDTIRDADDFDVVLVDNSKSIRGVQFGGVIADLMPIAETIQRFANTAGGNTDLLGGAGADTDKATIFSGLAANAANVVEDYVDIHDEWQDTISADLGFHILNDPFLKMGLTYRAPGGELFRVQYDAETKRGDSTQFRFKIKRRSMGRMDANVRSARLLQLLDTIFKGAEIAAATGLVNPIGVAKIAGQALDQTADLEEILNDPVLAATLQQITAMSPVPMPGQPSMNVNPGYGGPRVAPQGRGSPQQQPGTSQGQVRSALQQRQPQAPAMVG